VHRRRPRWTLLGPAFIAAVAYVDPGNVATNVTAGADFGYTLAWVVVAANLMAVLVQYLSAKLGIVTRRSLAAHLGERLSTPARILYWLQAELVAVATDMAEVVGGAVAMALLFHLPMVVGALCTAAVSLVLLRVADARGQRAFERVIMVFLGLIAVGFVAGLVVNPPSAAGLAGGMVPRLDGTRSMLLASGIVGATVMPHVIYLHSSLTTSRLGRSGRGLDVKGLLSATRVDVIAALAVAGALNLSLLLVAATSLRGLPGTGSLEAVHALFASEFGGGVALLFAVALLSSGLASTSVGSAAGAEVMSSLLHARIPMTLRRGLTVIPAVAILALGADPSKALIGSQVALSLGIPLAVAPLVRLTADRRIMGDHLNGVATTICATLIATCVVVLNAILLALTVT